MIGAPAVFDTSVFVGREIRTVGTLDHCAPVVSAITIAELKRTISANDSWIAATALALGVPLITQDDDFDAAASMIQIKKI